MQIALFGTHVLTDESVLHGVLEGLARLLLPQDFDRIAGDVVAARLERVFFQLETAVDGLDVVVADTHPLGQLPDDVPSAQRNVIDVGHRLTNGSMPCTRCPTGRRKMPGLQVGEVREDDVRHARLLGKHNVDHHSVSFGIALELLQGIRCRHDPVGGVENLHLRFVGQTVGLGIEQGVGNLLADVVGGVGKVDALLQIRPFGGILALGRFHQFGMAVGVVRQVSTHGIVGAYHHHH